jgi:hypothetical protein
VHLLLLIACYLAGAVALVSVSAMSWSMLTASGETVNAEIQRPKLVRKADGHSIADRPVEAPHPNGAFRYGPEINHGRADTPVNHAQQALKEARSAPVRPRKKPYQERRIVDPGVAIGYAPSVRPSGH